MTKQQIFKPLGHVLVAALAFFGATSVGAQSAAKVPLEAFFQDAAFEGAEISPTGKHVAMRVLNKSGRVQLVVLDTEKLGGKAVAGFSDGDVTNVHWVSDKRLVYGAGDRHNAMGGGFDSPGLFAVDLDGTEYRQLARVEWIVVERQVGGRQLLDPTTRMLRATTNRDSDDIFVTQVKFSDVTRKLESVNLLRVNTRTGAATTEQRPGKTRSWFVDTQDVARATVTLEAADRAAVHYMDPASEKWVKLAEFDSMTGVGGFRPVGFGPDGVLYVAQQRAGGTSALFRFDPQKKAVDPEPMVAIAGYDFAGTLLTNKKSLLGLRYVSDAESTVWFDPQYKEVQAKLDKLLPSTINRIDVPARPEAPFVMVHSFSDAEPGVFALYNIQTGKLTTLGKRMPAIDPRQMAQRDLVRYKARDGLEIPAWLTLPRDAKGKKVPLVVLVHGGPWVRGGQWKWDADSQFLASRGYAVLEPEFRGSTGYGFKHFQAGWKQWGLAMQNDVADGARWAIEKGMVDPARICIAGASYGGYATLMGLVNDPDLYRCGVNWLGVTDIDLMYTAFWSDLSDASLSYGMPMLIGDPEKDSAQLKATSPIQQASRIKQPLLLAYGGNDKRVPIVHGTKFRDAVQKTNQGVEWVDYPEEMHGWSLAKTRIDFWSRVEKFLEKNIGAK